MNESIFNPAVPSKGPAIGIIDVESDRAIQQVQAQAILAKKFPRDISVVKKKIVEACSNVGLAERSSYSYEKGNSEVAGPSIRIAEALVQCMGNMDFGVIELDRRENESTLMAYAWDLESNNRKTLTFVARHVNYSSNEPKILRVERDIYETKASQSARRLRACILEVTPISLVQLAMSECEKTLKGTGDPLDKRIERMLADFDKIGVTREMLESRTKKKPEKYNEAELVMLRRWYSAIDDGYAEISDYFPKQGKSNADKLNEIVEAKTAPRSAVKPVQGSFDAAPAGSAPLGSPVTPKVSKASLANAITKVVNQLGYLDLVKEMNDRSRKMFKGKESSALTIDEMQDMLNEFNAELALKSEGKAK